MKVVIFAVGRMKAGPERDLLRRYVDRAQAMARGLGLGAEVVEIEESQARTAEQRKHEERTALEKKIPAGAAVLLLDERGSNLSSEAFAAEVARERDIGRPALALVIGGPDGHDPLWREQHRSLAFGAASFPHQLVRVLVAEQVYRAMTILAGHPYHRS